MKFQLYLLFFLKYVKHELKISKNLVFIGKLVFFHFVSYETDRTSDSMQQVSCALRKKYVGVAGEDNSVVTNQIEVCRFQLFCGNRGEGTMSSKELASFHSRDRVTLHTNHIKTWKKN